MRRRESQKERGRKKKEDRMEKDDGNCLKGRAKKGKIQRRKTEMESRRNKWMKNLISSKY